MIINVQCVNFKVLTILIMSSYLECFSMVFETINDLGDFKWNNRKTVFVYLLQVYQNNTYNIFSFRLAMSKTLIAIFSLSYLF